MSERMITKFPLTFPLGEGFSLSFPKETRVLHVAVERFKPYMWLAINLEEQDFYEAMDFLLIGDLDILPSEKLIHLGSFRHRWKTKHLLMYPPDAAAAPTGWQRTPRKLHTERSLDDTWREMQTALLEAISKTLFGQTPKSV